MSGATKRIVRDSHGNPAPQFFNLDTNQYEFLEGKDGASKIRADEGKIADLASLLAAVLSIKTTDGIKKITDALPAGSNLIGKISADAEAIADLKSALDELTAIKSTDGVKKITDALPEGTNEIGKAVISGDETLISGDPVSGTRTLVPGVAAEIFGGASAKSGRVMMSIKNTSTYAAPLRCRIGESSITAQKGLVLEPQATLTLFFNPKTATAVYAMPETNELKLEVTEI